jgi:GH15 family glucan-1,4-alpha-glucosidase
LGENDLDASLLRLAGCGYADPKGDRMRGTVARIRERLGTNGLLRRYLGEDGIPGDEGAFGICSFWGVECLALQGQLQEATQWFDSLLKYSNDVGLLSEELDPRTGELLGNFPQAFTHVGLINAALTLAHSAGYPQMRPASGEKPA